MSGRRAGKTLARQRALVEEFNRQLPVGTKVRYWKLAMAGEPSGEAVTRTPAELLGGHTAVVWLDGVTGCMAVDHVEASS